MLELIVVLDQPERLKSRASKEHSVDESADVLHERWDPGGEATAGLAETLAAKLQLACELGDPWRTLGAVAVTGRKSQWDVAMGLAPRGSQTTPLVKAIAG